MWLLCRILAVLPFLIVPSAGGFAQGLTADVTVARADWAAIADCLRESGRFPRSCIGAVVVVCATRKHPGTRAEAEIACSYRETAVWRQRLDTAATLLLERLESGPRERFLSLQSSWEGYAAQRCALAGDIPLSLDSALAQARCDLGQVANRALDIERLARSPNPGSALTR